MSERSERKKSRSDLSWSRLMFIKVIRYKEISSIELLLSVIISYSYSMETYKETIGYNGLYYIIISVSVWIFIFLRYLIRQKNLRQILDQNLQE